MRALKVTIAILGILFIFLCLAVYIFFETFDATEMTRQLTDQLSARLGRTLTVDKVDVDFSFKRGIFLNVHNVKMGEDPAFGQEFFLEVGSVKLNVDMQAVLAKRETVISGIDVVAPVIRIIRNEDGQINAQGISLEGGGRPSASPSTEAVNRESPLPSELAAPAPEASRSEKPKKTPVIPPFSIKAIGVEDGQVVFIDRNPAMPVQLSLSKLGLRITDFSLSKPFAFEMRAAVFSDQPDVMMQGKVQIDPATQQIMLREGVFSVAMAEIAVSRAVEAIPALAQAGMKEGLQGEFKAVIEELTAGPQGLTALTVHGDYSGGRVALDALPGGLENILVRYHLNMRDLDVPEFFISVGGGLISGRASLKDYVKKQQFAVEAETADVDVSALLPELQPGVKFVGRANSKLHISGEDFANINNLFNSIRGEGQMTVQDGRLVNFNILRLVLEKISMLPDLIYTIQDTIPAKYRDHLTQNVTVFKTVNLPFRIQNTEVSAPKITVDADLFAMDMEGAVDFSQNADIKNATIFFAADLSRNLVARVEELKYLLDESGRIKIPLARYKGKLSDYKPVPDAAYLGQKIIKNKGKEEILKFLDKVLPPETDRPAPSEGPAAGEGQPPSEGQPAPEQAPATPEKSRSPERELIEGLLNQILK